MGQFIKLDQLSKMNQMSKIVHIDTSITPLGVTGTLYGKLKYHTKVGLFLLQGTLTHWKVVCFTGYCMYYFNQSVSSVPQVCPTLCNPLDWSMPGFPVHHQLPEFTQTQVHWVGDAIHPSHPLSSPSAPAFNLSQHKSLFQWVSSLHFEHYLANMWDECNCAIVWTFFGIDFLWGWNENWPLPVL